MARVSKRKLSESLQKKVRGELNELLISLRSKKDIELFLEEFLTEEEKMMLGKRLILYMMIVKEFTIEDIYVSLSMSKETIRWYKSLFQSKSELFKKYIKNRVGKGDMKELWQKVEDILKPFSLALESKTNMKSRAKFLSGDY